MKSKLYRLFALLVLISMIVVPVSAQSPVPPTTKTAVESAIPEGEPFPYIVLFTGQSLVAQYGDVKAVESQNYLATLAVQREAILAEAVKVVGHDLEIMHVYDVILNGVAVNLTPAEAEKLSSLPGVRKVMRDTIETLDTDTGPTLIGAPDLWTGTATPDAMGTKGEGILAGIIDSGINFDHPSFSDTPDDGFVYEWTGDYLGVCAPGVDPAYAAACNDKVVGAYSYTKDAASETSTPEDSDGHGSHTASTVAGNTVDMLYDEIPVTISGVAPHAQIIAYDVCYPTPSGGQCAGNDSLAAIQQSIIDGVDVLNYSISGGSSPYSDPVELAYLEAFNAGIYVSTSAGNSGPTAATVAHLSPWLMTTAASTHGRVFSLPVSITAPAPVDPALVGMDGAPSSSPVSFNVTNAPLKYDPANVNGCAAFPAGYFAGSVALIQRGGCTFLVKLTNAQAAGAIGMLAFNNAGGPPIAMGGLEAATLPATMISLSKGLLVQAWLDTNPATTTVTILPDLTRLVNSDYEDIMGGFSSQGPTTAFDVLKPDVTAPGVNILAAVADATIDPDGIDEYDLYQGTSMSSPHNAGSGALMSALHPDWSPAAQKSAIMLTSYDDTILAPDGVTPAGPFNMGSGRIQLELAGLTGLVMDETYANFLAADPALGGDVRTLNIPSMYNSACVVNCTWERTFTSVAGAPATYVASVDAPAGMIVTVTPDTFTIDPGATQTVTITADVAGLPVDAWAFATVSFDTEDMHSSGLLAEGFDGAAFPPEGWAQYDIDADGTHWNETTAQYVSAPKSAVHVYDCDLAQEGWIVTPSISIPATGNTTLSFQQRGNWVGDLFYHGILVSTISNDPATGNFVEIAIPANPPEDAWTTTPVSVDLSTYAGQNIYVGFKYTGNCADDWWIDDVVVENDLAIGLPISDVHLPIALMPATSALPELINIEADANTGAHVLAENFSGIEITDFTATITGLALGMFEEQVVLEDPTSSNPYNGDGTYFVTIDVPAGARRLLGHVVESTSGDVDMFMGTGSTPSSGTVVCTSATGAVLEYCNVLNPAAGTYWILVQNFAQTEPGGDIIALSYAVVPGEDAGNMTVTADPDAVPVGTPYDLTIAWDEATMNGYDYWYAMFDAGTDAANPDNLGSVMVDLYRLPDAAAIEVSPIPVETTLVIDTTGSVPGTVTNLGDEPLDWEFVAGVTNPLAYENGPLVTHPGGGADGADASALQTALGMTSYGVGHALSSGYRVADDFVVPAGFTWTIDSATFYAYQTGSTTTSTINHVNFRIWDGDPSDPTSTVVFGDTTTNRLSTSVWNNSYRVLDTGLTGNTRPIMASTATAGVTLTEGTYWIDWQTGGTLASGPWAPAITILGQTTTGNGLQFDPATTAWTPVTDVGPQGFPFMLSGTAASGAGCDDPTSIPWLNVDPIAGTVDGDTFADILYSFDATGLAAGDYTATLCVGSNDVVNPLVSVPVILHVIDNEAPVAVDDAYSMDEDTVLTVDALTGVLVNDTDADGNPLTAILVTDVTVGTLALAVDGSFVYTPPADFFGDVTFTYVANDGYADSNEATVTITVIDVPDFMYIYLPVIMR